jgi:hypothetical protein
VVTLAGGAVALVPMQLALGFLPATTAAGGLRRSRIVARHVDAVDLTHRAATTRTLR